jgi:ABC-type bacteriocin/lantibiotic exporter with double-glycine peptidase domain/CRP-like cAMP-binding protein
MSASERYVSEDAKALVAELALLEGLSDDARRLVIESFVPVSFGFGEVIFEEGDEPDGFYVLVSGTARMLTQRTDGEEVTLATLGRGDVFGEQALLRNTSRVATARASGPVEALRLDAAVFRALLEVQPEVRARFELERERQRRGDLLRLSSPFSTLSPETLEQLVDALESVAAAKGDLVTRKGETPTCMYIVDEGRLRAFWETPDGKRRDVAYLRHGDFFGERTLLLGGPRRLNVEAVTDCRLLALGEDSFRRLLRESEAFNAVIEGRVERYEFAFAAHVPLDFAEELLPAEATVASEMVPSREPKEPRPVTGDVEDWVPMKDAARRPRIRRFPHVWQVDEMDCGSACLAMIARHYGRGVSLSHIRRAVHTGVDGTSLAGIVAGAKAIGLRARAVKASESRLHELPVPFVAHVDQNHWVVVYDADERRVRIADPARGLRRQSRREFEDRWSAYAAQVEYTPALEQAPLGEAKVGWIWQFFRPFWRTLVAAAALALVAAALQMVFPIFTQVIVDDVLADRDRGRLYLLLAGMAGVLLAMTGATLVQRFLLSRSAATIDGAALDFLTEKLLALPMSYFNTRRTGDIQRRLAGMRSVRTFMVQEGVRGLTAAATVAAALVLMFVFDWVLALVFLATVPAYAGLMRYSRRRLRPTFDSLEEAFGKYHSHQIDAIKGIETVKAAGAEHALRRRMLDQFSSLARRLFRADFTIMSYEAATQLVSLATLVLFLWGAALRVLAGDMTIGELVGFNALVLLANGPVLTLLSIWDELQFGQVLLNRMHDIVDQEPEQGTDRTRLRPVRTLEGRIELRNVSFRYSPISPPVVDAVSLTVEPGTMIAIVGRSGSGKTTLVRCLSGLLEPTSGAILYDGVDMRELSYGDLRRQIGYVLQESYLFDDTIAANIAFGAEEVDPARVEWAAKVANAHEFVARLPLGYDTRVGETGLLLSGGQRQRIAIARAIYNRPPVLVFDEATSALDSDSERTVQANLGEVFDGRTCFVIAHRLSTVREADLIVVLDRGRLVEQGTHEELKRRRGFYYYLVGDDLAV